MSNRGVSPGVSFVVPALNEEANVAATVGELREACSGLLEEYELILVDDGSTDRTGPIMDEIAAAGPRVMVVHNPRNLGLGGSYKVGLSRARCEHFMLVPGDNAWPSDGLAPILRAIGQADIVVPYVTNSEVRPLPRRLLSAAFTQILNLLFGLRLRYYNGVVVHRTQLLRQIEIRSDGFAYQAEALIKLIMSGATYVEVPCCIVERTAGNSKALGFRNFARVAGTIYYLLREVRRTQREQKLRK